MGCLRFMQALEGRVAQRLLSLAPDKEGASCAYDASFVLLPTEEIASGNHPPRRLLSNNAKAEKAFLSALNEFNPDVVHFHRFQGLTWSVFKAARKAGVPAVLSLYDCSLLCPRETLVDFNGETCETLSGWRCASCLGNGARSGVCAAALWALRGVRIRREAARAAALTVLSDSWHPLLARFGAKNVETLPLPLTSFPSEDATSSFREESGRMLFVGWLQERKGLRVVVEAMPRILKKVPNAKLTVVATGVDKEYETSLASRAAALGLAGRIEFEGRQSQDGIRKLIERAELVLVPEQWDNPQPLFLCEAMSYGKRIVASDRGGIPSLLGGGSRGGLASSGDPVSWAENATSALLNPDEWRLRAKAAREFIADFCSPARACEKLLEIYSAARLK